MSQHECSKLQKSYLGLQKSYDDDPYIFENLRKSFTTFVYNVFPDSVFNLDENGKCQICPDFETEQKHPSVNVISQALLIQISSRLYCSKA